MRGIFLILIILLVPASSQAEVEGWRKWFSPELRQLEQQRAATLRELEKPGVPVVGQTAAQLGYQLPRSSSHPLTMPWVQIDLQERQKIDSVVLAPALVDWQSSDRPPYAFPVRFRIDLSDDAQFKKFVSAGVFTEEDFPNPGIAPVTIDVGGKMARYVRLTVTKLAEENRQYFFALSELMVLSGNLNIAVGCPVRASGTMEIPPRWSAANLVDGRTPLGPPIKREFLDWDGLYAGSPGQTSNTPLWMQLDLGRVFPIQQVRLHPVHARFGADVPGFSFPKSFRVEASRTPDFDDAMTLLESHDYLNPGNNPVTISATNIEARYLKMTALEKNAQGDWRFGLSEIEVYSSGRNVAHDATVTRTPDTLSRSASWPASLLVDGFTSYGRLMELPEWLQSWKHRRALQTELQRIDQEEITLSALAQRRAVWIGSGLGIAIVLVAFGFVVFTRYKRERELRDLRLRLARDIHDDIGSNLAGIAVLSEVARDGDSNEVSQREDWREVNRIARDTLDAMREVLWLVGGRQEAGLDLMTHLQLAASRMLAGKEVHWKSTVDHLPPDLPLESRRQIFLFFKEALTNVVRHSCASRVELSLQISQRHLLLSIADDGCGFDPREARNGMGLNSQQMRARALGGWVKINSAPGKGTSVYLEVPLGNKLRRHLPFMNKSANSKLSS